jgi:glycosyltransferase involved in cell wall biosynthesis
VSTSPAELHEALRRFLRDRAAAEQAGLAAREAVCARYGLKRFIDDWNHVLMEASR